jgi:hypothetical protein
VAQDGGKGENGSAGSHFPMMSRERWLIAAIIGSALALAPVAGGRPVGQQNSAGQGGPGTAQAGGQNPLPAKAQVDPGAPPPPSDPQAEPPRKDDDLAPEPEGDGDSASGAAASDGGATGASGAAGKAETGLTGVDRGRGAVPSSAGQPAPPLNPAVEVAAKHPQRHGKYDEEAERLVKLTEELKSEVDKAGSNTLSLAALRKADEIQRLAKALKEKMRDQGTVTVNRP